MPTIVLTGLLAIVLAAPLVAVHGESRNSPEEALREAVEAIGANQRKRYIDTIHLPFYQIGLNTAFASITDAADAPEYFSDQLEQLRPEWKGSICRLDNFEVIIADEQKVAYLIKVTRLHPGGEELHTFNAIFTVAKKDNEWRVISRNPFNFVR